MSDHLTRRRAIEEQALRALFLDARTAHGFLPDAIEPALLERAVELAMLGPTSMNTLPARFVFVTSAEGKQRLAPALSRGNHDKTMAAPATAIVAADLHFYEHLGRIAPGREEAAKRFAAAEATESTRAFARDNALLQMGYFLLAARALGLDCGPMGGFTRSVVDEAFFPDGRCISLYLINLGYDDRARTALRLPRLTAGDVVTYA